VKFSAIDSEMCDEYINQGYIIRDVADRDAYEWIVISTSNVASQILDQPHKSTLAAAVEHLDRIHECVTSSSLNDFRLKIIQGLHQKAELRPAYFSLARPYLYEIVGNELAMQQRVNLSIQLPDDSSSLLPVHADTWSGDSPYEVVVWFPLVDCYATKAMYLLPPPQAAEFDSRFAKNAGTSSDSIFDAIQKDVKWLEIRSGEVMIFDQSLPHGNRVNEERQTRWSMNCRFKSIFTPYGDKKLGEFFEPIALRPATRRGMSYQLPKIK